MNFTVLWTPEAQTNMLRAWQELDTTVLLRSLRLIDLALSRDPLRVGESRYEDVRISFENPVGVLFRVDESARTVFVLTMWLY